MNAKVSKRERYTNVLELAKPLAAMGQSSIHAYRLVAAGLDALQVSVLAAPGVSKPISRQPAGGGGTASVPDGPLNPRVQKKDKGKLATKRKKSAMEQRGA